MYKKSIKMCLVRSLNSISMVRKREVILCLLDLSSAFDTLKHNILLQRLHDIGIKGSALE